jgi:hypothetical protein
MNRRSRRAVLSAGIALTGIGLAGCRTAPDGDGPVLAESFESGMDGWTTAAHIGPEEPLSAFEWEIERSQAEAADGDWSLDVFTEGDHDDGTAWATTEVEIPDDADALGLSVDAWSPSESFNTLRHLVAYVGPDEPTEEGDFPDPGMNSTDVDDAPVGGLREPLHLAEGWREYAAEWRPETMPEEVVVAVGVSVVWEADATHYIDDVALAVV